MLSKRRRSSHLASDYTNDQLSTASILSQAPLSSPWPGTVAGTFALVEAYQALKRRGTEVGVGGTRGSGGGTSLTSLPPTKPKREPTPVVWNGKRPSKDRHYDGPDVIVKYHESLPNPINFSTAKKKRTIHETQAGVDGRAEESGE